MESKVDELEKMVSPTILEETEAINAWERKLQTIEIKTSEKKPPSEILKGKNYQYETGLKLGNKFNETKTTFDIRLGANESL